MLPSAMRSHAAQYTMMRCGRRGGEGEEGGVGGGVDEGRMITLNASGKNM